MATKIPISDQRILQLMEWAVKSDIVSTEGEFWEQIGFTRTNLRNVRMGLQSFRIEHITKACLLTGASADWVLGISKEMFRTGTTKDPLQLLRQVTATIEAQLGLQDIDQKKKRVNKKVNSKVKR